MLSADIQIVMPEVVLALYAMIALLVAVYTTKDAMAPLLTWVTSGLFVVMAFWLGVNGEGTNIAFGGTFVDDGFARFSKIVILLSAAAVLLMSETYMQQRGLLRFEYPLLVALAVVGIDGVGFGWRSDGALHGARAAVAVALRGSITAS